MRAVLLVLVTAACRTSSQAAAQPHPQPHPQLQPERPPQPATVATGSYTVLTSTGPIESEIDISNIDPAWWDTSARVEDGEPTLATANHDKALIRKRVQRSLPSLRACYKAALRMRPSLGGTLTVTFAISGTGKVTSSTIAGIGDAELHRCIARTVSAIRLTGTADGKPVVVTYPFQLLPPR